MTIETVKVDYLNPREGNTPPSIKCGKTYYGVSDDDFDKFEQGKRYTVNVISREGKGKWAGRTFYDITAIHANLSGSGPASGAAEAGTGPAVAANGHAAPANGDREKAILTAVLAKMVAPVPLGTREQMANAMTLIYLAAQDACDRIVS